MAERVGVGCVEGHECYLHLQLPAQDNGELAAECYLRHPECTGSGSYDSSKRYWWPRHNRQPESIDVAGCRRRRDRHCRLSPRPSRPHPNTFDRHTHLVVTTLNLPIARPSPVIIRLAKDPPRNTAPRLHTNVNLFLNTASITFHTQHRPYPDPNNLLLQHVLLLHIRTLHPPPAGDRATQRPSRGAARSRGTARQLIIPYIVLIATTKPGRRTRYKLQDDRRARTVSRRARNNVVHCQRRRYHDCQPERSQGRERQEHGFRATESDAERPGRTWAVAGLESGCLGTGWHLGRSCDGWRWRRVLDVVVCGGRRVLRLYCGWLKRLVHDIHGSTSSLLKNSIYTAAFYEI